MSNFLQDVESGHIHFLPVGAAPCCSVRASYLGRRAHPETLPKTDFPGAY